MKRRSFLAGIIAAGAAPAIVRASSLMPIVAPRGFRIPDVGWGSGWVAGDKTVIVNGVADPSHTHAIQNWAQCDGGILLRDQYPALFGSMAGYWCEGDRPGEFKLPGLLRGAA